MRTRTFSLLILVLLMAATSAVAETVAGLPLHVQKLGDGVIRVWIGDHISSTAVVAFATEEGLVIVDNTGNPSVDRELRVAIARELGRDDFKYLINTHEHGDHTGSNALYADCTIVGHELVAEGMSRFTGDLERRINWNRDRIAQLEDEIAQAAADAPETARLQEELVLERVQLADWTTGTYVQPPAPTKTFSDRMTLDCGDTTFELYYIGGMHTASDIAIFVPEHGLLLTGDTMADVWLTDTPGCLASFGARPGTRHDFPLWLENWKILLAKKDAIKTLLPGHWNGELSYEGAAARVYYVETLWNAANSEGMTISGMLTGCVLTQRFPELAEARGFTGFGNYGTIVEIWAEATGEASAGNALFNLIDTDADEAEIAAVVAHSDAESPSYFFLEAEINSYGYRFMQLEKPAEAVAMFRINTELYPESWNVWDSYAEALLAAGDRDASIAMYEKSIELNPESTSGPAALERIRGADSVN